MAASIAIRLDRTETLPNGCLLWLGARTLKGYGVLTYKNKPARAHRVAWELANGPIPDGLCVCHSCDFPGCINLDHLWLGTNAENTADRHAKGRDSKHGRPTNASRKLKRQQELANADDWGQ